MTLQRVGGLGDATEGVGAATGPPPVGEYGLLPPAVIFLPEAGGAAKILPGTPPSIAQSSSGEEPGGGYLDWVCARQDMSCRNICKGFIPGLCVSGGGRKKISPPPLCCKACNRGGGWPGWWPGWALAALGRCTANFDRDSPPRLCLYGGGLQMFCQESPPLLQVVQERGALAGPVACVSTCWVRAER